MDSHHGSDGCDDDENDDTFISVNTQPLLLQQDLIFRYVTQEPRTLTLALRDVFLCQTYCYLNITVTIHFHCSRILKTLQ
jgi:hypothetical protein